MLKVIYRKSDDQEEEPKAPKPKKTKLYNDRAYIEALKQRLIHAHNAKFKKTSDLKGFKIITG